MVLVSPALRCCGGKRLPDSPLQRKRRSFRSRLPGLKRFMKGHAGALNVRAREVPLDGSSYPSKVALDRQAHRESARGRPTGSNCCSIATHSHPNDVLIPAAHSFGEQPSLRARSPPRLVSNHGEGIELRSSSHTAPQAGRQPDGVLYDEVLQIMWEQATLAGCCRGLEGHAILSVHGDDDLPPRSSEVDMHESRVSMANVICPVVANRTAQQWPLELPSGGQ